jgi:DivIVA domain-containing protein
MSDLDLPLLPSAEQIRRRQFATVRRGYDPDQVHDYLNQVALQVEALEGELREQRLAPAPPEEGGEGAAPPAPVVPPQQPAAPLDAEAAYDRISKRFATVLKATDEESQKLIEQAREESTKLLEEARAEADRIRVDAQANAEEARTRSREELERAKAEADRVLGGLEQRREALLGQMHEMQSRLLSVAQNLEIPEEQAAAAHTGGSHVAQDPASPPEATGESVADQDASAEAGQQDEPAAVRAGPTTQPDDAVDPRYEDMWATPRQPVEMPDLSSIDIDFEEESK